MNDIDEEKRKYDFVPVNVRSFAVIVLVSVFAYRVATAPIHLQFDFSTFLSLVLALFSVGLSALFYFKATDTSNKFYDNTYKFSQDIGELLARIESGFGERLRHLDDSYSSMREQLQHYPANIGTTNPKQEIKEEEKELQQKLNERNKMIEDLATRAQLQEDEKKAFIDKLNVREQELSNTRQELDFLRRQLVGSHMSTGQRISLVDSVPEAMQSYMRHTVLDVIGQEIIFSAPIEILTSRFQKLSSKFNPDFLNDMKKHGLLTEENKLTSKGIRALRAIIRK